MAKGKEPMAAVVPACLIETLGRGCVGPTQLHFPFCIPVCTLHDCHLPHAGASGSIHQSVLGTRALSIMLCVCDLL